MKFSIGDIVLVSASRKGEVLDYAAGVDRYLVHFLAGKVELIVNPINMRLIQSAELKENE